MKDGDIFRWRYKDEESGRLGRWGIYHCRSRIAVAKNGVLYDTYWLHDLEKPSRGDNGESWLFDDVEASINLEALGNLADLEKRSEHQVAYYDDADCVDLNHSNSSRGNFYVRKGAKRSRSKMTAVAAERLANAEVDARRAQQRAERFKEIVADLTSGKPLDEVYL